MGTSNIGGSGASSAPASEQRLAELKGKCQSVLDAIGQQTRTFSLSMD